MQFDTTPLPGALIVKDVPAADDRGAFTRIFNADEFAAAGLPGSFPQISISRNIKQGTLRGMHFQRAPKPEGKLVRCIRGRIYDVIIDLRPHSPSYRQWFSIELSETGTEAIYVPPGLAHGFMTLTDHAEVLYQISERYVAELSGGVRWNDPAFGISWPAEPVVISRRDNTLPDYR